MKTVTITFIGHEQANAFLLWLTENGGLKAFEESKWAKIVNMYNIEENTINEIEDFKLIITS